MKRYIKLIFVLSAVMLVFGFVAYAEEILPPESIAESEEFEEKAAGIYESFSFKTVFSNISEALKEAFVPSLSVFSGLLGMVIIAAVANSFSISLGGFDVGGYVSVLCLSGYVFSVIQSLCSALSNYTEKLRDVMAVITPTLIAASAADGVLTAQTGYTGLSVTLTAAEFIVTGVVLPCVKVLFTLSLTSCISDKTADLRGISSSLRTFSVFSVSLVMTAIVTVMHFQNIVAKAADSVGLRAVRFASVSFVPLVGGLVGESVKTVTEALRAVRGLTGAAGVAAIISVCLPPLAAIIVYKLELIACTCLAKTLGCRNEAALLSETNGILNVLNAALISSTIGFAAIICIVAHAAQ